MGNKVSTNTNTNTSTNTSTNTNTGIVKKALLIGINYTGTENELRGCINDSHDLKNFLVENKYFDESEITMVNDTLDDAKHLYPSKINIIYQFNELVKFADENKDKNVFIYVSYSGHGSYITDLNGDETDGRDEVLCPIDCMTNGFIVDDDIKKMLVDKLSSNVKLVFMSDSCHSGTVLDLKYLYKFDQNNTIITDKKIKDSNCDVILISGCRDNQTSADAYVPDKSNNYLYQGAMTASFIKVFNDEISYKDLITKMRAWLTEMKFSQVPQLSSGKKIDLTKPFLLSCYNN